MRTTVTAALGVCSLFIAQAAMACPPPPPLPGSQPIAGEDEATYRARLARLQAEAAERGAAAMRQHRLADEQRLWATADQVVVVEVRAIRSVAMRDNWGAVYGHLPAADLRVILPHRGNGARRTFRLQYGGDTSCGPYGPLDLQGLEQGQLIVVFAGNGAIGMDNVAGTIRADQAQDPATLALFEQARR
jgi:hypothetical protein